MNCPIATRRISRIIIFGMGEWVAKNLPLGEEFSEDVAPQMAGNQGKMKTLL